MWPFKKKTKEKKYKKVKTISYKEAADFTVGTTVVNLTFSDGRTFSTMIYGSVDQHINPPIYSGSNNAYCSPTFIINSLGKARLFIQECYAYGENAVFFDDPLEIYTSISGKVIKAAIGETYEEFSIKFSEAYVLETEVEYNG